MLCYENNITLLQNQYFQFQVIIICKWVDFLFQYYIQSAKNVNQLNDETEIL